MDFNITQSYSHFLFEGKLSMFMRDFMPIVCLTGAALFVVGCGGSDSKPSSPAKSPPASAKSDPNEHADHKDTNPKTGESAHTHSHERGKMLIADAGPYHALLTAHLSKDGNELDIFFETPDDKDPQPAAIAITSFDAQATAGEGDSQTLTYEPAPADERPASENAGTCSHFVAKAAWMKPDDDLLVVAKFKLDGKEVVGRWKIFVPKKYAHHID